MTETAERRFTRTPPVEGSEARAGPPPPEPLTEHDLTRAVRTGYLALSAIAGLVSILVSLVFLFAPGLRPDPGDNIGADATVVALEPATLGDWINRGFEGEARARMVRDFGEQQLDYEGAILSVRVSVDGHKHDDVVLGYHLYSVETHRRIELGTGFSPPTTLDIQAPSQRSVQLMFLSDLSDEPDMFVRVELRDADGLLAVSNSGRIHKGLLPF